MDSISRYCTNCGHLLSVGRYCTNCGARVPVTAAGAGTNSADYPTAVRPGALPPIPAASSEPQLRSPAPPPVPPAPSSARYPLFADSVPARAPVAAGAPPRDTAPAERRTAMPWVAAFAVLAVIAVTGGALLLLSPSGDADDDTGDRDRRRAGGNADPADPLEPSDVEVPDTAPPSIDDAGNRVTFKADNLLDSDPHTSWRMAGDGTGSVVTFTFDEPVTVTGVGLINGYAKTDPPHDWYQGNRRIVEVVWAFDDASATEVEQELGSSQSVQTAEVPSVTTTTVELRILGVTAPGAGPDGRDFTAISEVEISGS